ncbi:LysM peptidoglycan-binding domain-containing protein, partial [Herbaspirillum sp. RTI4]|uniref:LysM peptidoglycan-binding domain-containing protein n=1 Tax=Herbaspirillum sp. RTI4 TaxID=3048640 RepID=UPI002B22A942
MQEYIVKKGDSLWKIAKRYQTSVEALAFANKLKGRHIHALRIGQKLHLPGETDQDPDTILKVKFKALDATEFTPKKVMVEHDGKKETHILSKDKPLMLQIADHAQGLKIWIEDLSKKMVQVMDQTLLPIGERVLSIQSRKVKVQGNLLPKKGTANTSAEAVKSQTASKADKTGGKLAQAQTRIEDGKPVHVVATVHTDNNLLLCPGNEPFRADLIAAAKHGLSPQALAAMIDAEARKKDSSGAWDERSNEQFPSRPQGLAQFFVPAWKAVFNNTASQLCKDCKGLTEKELLEKRLEAKYAIDAAAVYAKANLEQFEKSSRIAVSGLPPDEKAKIAYLLHHEGVGGLARLLSKDNPYDAKEATTRLKGQLGKSETRTQEYIKQYGSDPLAAYKGWLYTHTDTHINVRHFMVKDIDKSAKPVRTTAEIIADICVQPLIPKPAPRKAVAAKHPAPSAPAVKKPAVPPAHSPAKPSAPVAPKTESNDSPSKAMPATPQTESVAASHSDDESKWFDPLEVCTLRVHHLRSIKGALFGMTRKDGKKAHQGIDLAADTGTPIIAVANGIIRMYPDAPDVDYGNRLVLQVKIDDLPSDKAALVKKIHKENGNKGDTKIIGFAYSHLSEYEYPPRKDGQPITVYAGEKIGKTGTTGNANGMKTIAQGGHLHFEVRINPIRFITGLENRADPLPFI